MPQVRKLPPEEVARLAGNTAHPPLSRPASPPNPLNGRDPFFDNANTRRDAPPRLGDIVYFRYGPVMRKGIVTYIWWHRNEWRGVEVLDEGILRSISATNVGRKLGRPPGISRIDQIERRTHGWFVRIYKGGRSCVSRMFSDGKHGGSGTALVAALAFREHRSGDDE